MQYLLSEENYTNIIANMNNFEPKIMKAQHWIELPDDIFNMLFFKD